MERRSQAVEVLFEVGFRARLPITPPHPAHKSGYHGSRPAVGLTAGRRRSLGAGGMSSRETGQPVLSVSPEMALVTDIRGECRAGVTPQTVWYPTMPARPKVVTIWVKAALGAARPRPSRVVKPGGQTAQ